MVTVRALPLAFALTLALALALANALGLSLWQAAFCIALGPYPWPTGLTHDSFALNCLELGPPLRLSDSAWPWSWALVLFLTTTTKIGPPSQGKNPITTPISSRNKPNMRLRSTNRFNNQYRCSIDSNFNIRHVSARAWPGQWRSPGPKPCPTPMGIPEPSFFEIRCSQP